MLQHVNRKNGLVRLEDHTVINSHVLVDIQPSAICAGLSFVAVVQDPSEVLRGLDPELDVALHFREQFITNSNVALRSPSKHNLTIASVHLLDREFMNFAVIGATKYLKSN